MATSTAGLGSSSRPGTAAVAAPAVCPRLHRPLRLSAGTSAQCRAFQQRQQQPASCCLSRPQQPQRQQQQQQLVQPSQGSLRQLVIAAAGRRRRQPSGAAAEQPEDEEPDLDIDDVMYAGDGAEDDDDSLLEEEDEEPDDFDDFDADADEDWLEDEGGEDEEEGAAGVDDAEGWDAALVNFDESQDVQEAAAAASEPQGPTPEERERAAALAMVRFDEHDGDADGTQLEISEVVPQEPVRPKTFDEQTTQLSVEDKQTLEQNMAAYTVFPMFFCDLLVSSTPDGRLNLADCFCLDTLDDTFLRPSIGPGVSSDPGLYQLLPWEHMQMGDILKKIEPQVSLMKMYFVGLHSTSPQHEVDMSRVFSFDVSSRTMSAHTPQLLGHIAQEDMQQPVLRIREDGVFIEEAAAVPGSFFIAEGFAGHPTDPYLNPSKPFNIREFVHMGLWDEPRSMEELMALAAGEAAAAAGGAGAATAVAVPGGAAAAAGAGAAGRGVAEDEADVESRLEERLEELELMEELDDMPDVPAIDMM